MHEICSYTLCLINNWKMYLHPIIWWYVLLLVVNDLNLISMDCSHPYRTPSNFSFCSLQAPVHFTSCLLSNFPITPSCPIKPDFPGVFTSKHLTFSPLYHKYPTSGCLCPPDEYLQRTKCASGFRRWHCH